MSRPWAALLVALLAAGAGARVPPKQPADVFTLKNGDRVSGRTVAKGRRTFTLQTPWGRLVIPRSEVALIVWSDGREELLVPGATAAEPGLALVVAVSGRSFWQAWDPRRSPAPDPTLRLALWLDEAPLATYSDTRSDPQDLPGALVNTFDFTTPTVTVSASAPVVAEPPEVRPGRITLRLRLPVSRLGEHRLRLAYQVNEGTPEAPAWRDVVDATLPVQLKAESPAVAELQQDPGRMEYARRRMRNVETFRLTPREGPAPPPAPTVEPGPTPEPSATP